MGIIITKKFNAYRSEHAYYGRKTGGNYGAMIGAGAGAAIGRQLGGKSLKGQAIGALAGGLVGGIGGFIGGRKLGSKAGSQLSKTTENKRFEVTYSDPKNGLERHRRFDFIQDAQLFQRQHPGSRITDLHHQQGQPNYTDEEWS